MRERKCRRCLFYDICGGSVVCRHFAAFTDDDIEAEERAAERRYKAEYYEAWIDYIDEDFQSRTRCLQSVNN